MKILDRITMNDLIAEHMGYDDQFGRWYETYSGPQEGVVSVVANPTGIGNGIFDWMTIGLLTEEEEEEE